MLSCANYLDCERSVAQMKCAGAGWSVGCTGGRECTCLMGKLNSQMISSDKAATFPRCKIQCNLLKYCPWMLYLFT